jgi:hypothetical protein
VVRRRCVQRRRGAVRGGLRACERGLEGVVAKRRLERYRPSERRWIKVKNRGYWRHGEEIESLRGSIERRRLR